MERTNEILAKLMEHFGHSQADLARATGVNQPTICRMLKRTETKGTASASDAKIRAISGFYGITPDQLRGYEPFEIEGIAMSSEQSSDFNDAIAWLSVVSNIRDEGDRQALLEILKMASAGEINSKDIRLLHDMANRVRR